MFEYPKRRLRGPAGVFETPLSLNALISHPLPVRFDIAIQRQQKKFSFFKKTLAFFLRPCYNNQADLREPLKKACGLVAQLDRVFDYESKGRGFESRRAHQEESLKP